MFGTSVAVAMGEMSELFYIIFVMYWSRGHQCDNHVFSIYNKQKKIKFHPTVYLFSYIIFFEDNEKNIKYVCT